MAILGLYGLLAFVVRKRTHEVGIRIALGASESEILAAVLRQGFLLVIFGMVLGLGAACAASLAVASLFYGVRGNDPASFAEAFFLLAVAVFVAMYIPARRAAKLNPMVALRYE